MKTVQILFSVAAMISVAGCGRRVELSKTPAPDLGEAYPEVKEFIREKRDAVERDRSSASAWGEYAMALDAHEYGETAERCYEVAVSLEPESSRWKYLLARRLERQHPERAIELLRSIVSQGEPDTVVLLKLAALLEELGDSESLQTVLSQLRQQSSDCPAVLHRLALSAFAKGDVGSADELNRSIGGVFRESVRLRAQIDARNGRPENPHADLNAAEEYPSVLTTVTDRFSAELDRFRRDPLWLGKKASEEAQAGSESALMSLAALVREHPQLTENRVQLALNLSMRGRNDDAERLLREGLESAPKNVRLLVALASVRLLDSNWQAAEETLRQIIELQANHSEAWADLGFALEQQGRQADAVKAYQAAVKLNPRDHELATRLQTLLDDRK